MLRCLYVHCMKVHDEQFVFMTSIYGMKHNLSLGINYSVINICIFTVIQLTCNRYSIWLWSELHIGRQIVSGPNVGNFGPVIIFTKTVTNLGAICDAIQIIIVNCGNKVVIFADMMLVVIATCYTIAMSTWQLASCHYNLLTVFKTC